MSLCSSRGGRVVCALRWSSNEHFLGLVTCSGGMEDFESWYRAERPRVMATCAALCGDVDAASEATDEAFVRALERWSSVVAMASPGGWVQVVALNHLRRGLRRRGEERRLLKGSPVDAGLAIPDWELWSVVAGLPRRQRSVVVLRYVHDLSEATIAGVLGVSRGTVASTLAAAQASLRRQLSETVTRPAVVISEETR